MEQLLEKVKLLNPTEVVAAVTLLSAGGAVLFNIGYFSPIGISNLSLLSFQDMLIGASYTIVIALLLCFITGAVLISQTNGRLIYVIVVGATSSVAIMILLSTATSFSYASIPLVGCFWLVLLGTSRYAATKLTGWLFIIAFFGGMSPLVLGVAVGRGMMESLPTNPTTVTFSDDSQVSGALFRITSSYIFIVRGERVDVLALKDIKSFTRQRIQ